MASAQDILHVKGPAVTTVEPGISVYDAAVLMNEKRIGSLLVMNQEKLVGIFTERDILRRIVAQRKDPAATLVGDVMTAGVACCRLDTPLEEVQTLMMNRRIRHLPVVDADEKLVGLISIGDLNAFYARSQEQTIHMLREYIGGNA